MERSERATGRHGVMARPPGGATWARPPRYYSAMAPPFNTTLQLLLRGILDCSQTLPAAKSDCHQPWLRQPRHPEWQDLCYTARNRSHHVVYGDVRAPNNVRAMLMGSHQCVCHAATPHSPRRRTALAPRSPSREDSSAVRRSVPARVAASTLIESWRERERDRNVIFFLAESHERSVLTRLP